jgi:hypothetical protein
MPVSSRRSAEAGEPFTVLNAASTVSAPASMAALNGGRWRSNSSVTGIGASL